MVAKSNISGAKIPPGQLVNFIQKGIMYAELERSIAADGTDHPSTEPFSLLQSPAAEKRGGKGASGGASSSEPVAMDTDGGGGELTPEEQVTTLAGHDGEVFICAWSPTSLQLASGSGDSTARIWAVPSGACGKAQTKAMAAPSVLQHVGADKEKVKDVTTLDWSPDGASLATGAYDGQARIWSGAAGKLLRTLTKHKGPIFSIKWNRTGARRPVSTPRRPHSTPHAPPPSHHTRPRPRLAPAGEYLLTGSFDETTIVWDAATGAVKQQFSFHNKPTLDVRRAPLGQRRPRGRAPHALPLPPAGGLARRDVVRVVLDRQDGVRVQGGAGLVPQVLRGPPGRGARAAPAHATAGRPLPSAAPPRR